MSDTDSEYTPDSIAIIGMSGRFPGAPDLEVFWQNLCAGVESITFFPDSEVEASGLNPDLLALPNLVKAAPILDDIDLFDASFFGYTPREAQLMDPQHRIFLECAWEALEHAGYDSEQYKEWIGVYGGVAVNGYLLNNLYGRPDIIDPVNALQLTTANERDYLTTRVSYKLDLKGPSVNLQTACSTSLVAVHLACQGLLNYQCDMALAGGISIRIPQKGGYWYQEGGITSPDGHCRVFDADAQGTVFGGGVGVVVLRRLADALEAGDHIHAIIKGSAVNNDGSLKAGFTAPSVEGQKAVVAMAQGIAGVDPETISYIEAHGTGTNIGDPIEVAALTQVFRTRTQKKGFCAIGSVKTNIGHASAAAGIAGLIKTVLALKHRTIPPSLHFRTPNPKINFADSPFYVNTTLSEWRANGVPRRAGVSSFGVGGTNAHLILEEAPPVEQHASRRPWQLLVLSAKTDSALDAATARLADHLERHPDLNLADVAYTLQVGRRSFNHRRALVCRDVADALDALRGQDPARVATLTCEQRELPVAFMFSGQGAQYVNMARELYQTEPTFREHVDWCARLLRPQLGLDLREVLYPTGDWRLETGDWGAARHDQPPASSLQPPALEQTWLAQPALFVIEYALAQLWMSWGVQPRALIGHSIGEYVAACVAGVFSLEDALALVAARGRLMQQMPPGAMLAVSLPEHEVLALLEDQLSLAAVNGPARCVVAGPFDAVEALERRLAERGVDTRRLHTSHAFHSSMMDPIFEPFIAQVQQVALRAPKIPFVSNVTGTWITPAEATDPAYWARHLRQPVRFADGLRELLQEPAHVLLEVGPGQTLSALARQYPDRAPAHTVLPSLRAPQEQRSDAAILLHALGQLWLAGLPLDWLRLYTHERRQRVPLPTYPFERQRYWIDPPDLSAIAATRTGSLRKKPDIASWFSIPSWKRSLLPPREPGAEQPLCWLILCDHAGLGQRLARRLAQEGHTVVTAAAGEQFGRSDERAYTLRPAERADYDALLKQLGEASLLPQRIAHLWNVTPAGHSWSADEHAAQDDLSFYSVLFLIQALGGLPGLFQLGVVSNNMQHVAGEEQLDPAKALLLGPCKVARQEYPNITCQSIDVVLPRAAAPTDGLVDLLMAEFAARSDEPVVAYRGYDRWVQSYEPVRLAEAAARPARLRRGGTYLITGGLGGIGLVLAEYLAEAALAKLVLVGRSAFPERVEWERWLATHDPRDSVSHKIAALRKLEDVGAEVMVVSADVADAAQVRALIAQVHERFGALHGVIHAAGIAGGGLIPLKTREMAARVLAPKVAAICALDAALADADLDFLVLCSSTIAIIGGIGQVDYCAANAFLDAYAHARTARRGGFTISINWDAWQEVGMAVDAAAGYDLREQGRLAPGRTVEHPLFDTCSPAANQQIYRTEFSPATHWVLSEHKVMGIPTIPGTAYLEMARAAFADAAGAGPIELQDVFFLTPLMIQDDTTKEARTILTGSGDSAEFRVVSTGPASGGGQPAWQEHTRGRVARLPGAAAPQHDIRALVERCSVASKTVTAQELEDLDKFVYWGPRWRSIRTIHIGENEGIARLELPQEFALDVGQFWLHPAMLDVATAFGSGLVGEGSNYLPLSYRRLRVYGPFTSHVYSYVKYNAADAANKETLSFDIVVADEQGRELVAIEEFTLKRVNAAAIKLREQASHEHPALVEHAGNGAGPGSAAPAGASHLADGAGRAAPVVGILSREGVEVFKRILAHNRLAQIVVSTKDLSAAIERANASSAARVLEQIDEARDGRAMLPRPEVQSAYVAPRNAVEQRLAEVWQGVLGIDQVGVHDNFFELGGDSVLAIQIIAKCGSAGVQITPAQLFQYQTIATLAAGLAAPAPAPSDPAPGAGTTPLTPTQRWLLEQFAADTQHACETFLLETDQPLDPALLRQALWQLIGHHDALRLRFVPGEVGWRLIDGATARRATYTYADLSDTPEPAWPGLTEAIAAGLGAGLHLTDGPIMRMVQVGHGEGRPARLLLAVHRLMIDGASWPILLEDLQTAYRQLARGAAVQLAAQTSSFQRWAERLQAYAVTSNELQVTSNALAGADRDPDSSLVTRHSSLVSELDYWLAPERLRVAALPMDLPEHKQADPARTITATLSGEETSVLLNALVAAHHTTAEEVVLTAVALALKSWTGASRLLLDVERRGERQQAFGDINLSRTVGCCAALFPLLLSPGRAADPISALKAIKGQLHSVPNGGARYGLLRYLSEDAEVVERLGAMPQAEVYFAWHGQLAPPAPDSAPPWSAQALRGPAYAGRRYRLAITARVAADQLRLDWTYDPATCRQSTVAQLAQRFVETARSLIAHDRSGGMVGLTSSDFPEAGLSQAELDKFLNSMNR